MAFLEYVLLFVIFVAIALNFYNTERYNRLNNTILYICQVFLLWWGTSIIFDFESNKFVYFVFLSSIPLTISFLTLFIERELAIQRFSTISSQLCGGSLLTAYLEALNPSNFQFILYNILILLSLLLLVYRWIHMVHLHFNLSKFYGFEFKLTTDIWYLFYGSFVIFSILGFLSLILGAGVISASIFFAIVITAFFASFTCDNILSTGLNQKVYAIFYIENDKMKGFVEFGKNKILDMKTNEAIQDDFSMAMRGFIDMTSELSKSKSLETTPNYIGFTDLYTNLMMIDSNRYIISIQARKSKQMVKHLEKLSALVGQFDSFTSFESTVHEILGLN